MKNHDVNKLISTTSSLGRGWLNMVPEVTTWILILLFLHTGIDKLAGLKTFTAQMERSPLIGAYAHVLGILVPVGEVVTAMLLVFGRTRLAGLYSSVFLMSVFTAYIYAMLKYSYHLDCSCGGVTKYLDWTAHLWFNTIVLVLSILAASLSQRQNPGAIS